MSQTRRFVAIPMMFVVAMFTFLSDERYSREWYEFRPQWDAFLAGKSDAPAQYRIGVIYLANFLSGLTHGHLALRHMLALMDGIFLAIAGTILFYLISQTKTYLQISLASRVAAIGFSFALLLYYMSWLFYYHKAETVANLACLAVGAALISGRPRIPVAMAALGLVLVSAYLATVRADSGVALNVGIIVVSLFPGDRILPLGRWVQAVAGIAGIGVILAVEYHITHRMFPNNPYPDSKFQLIQNFTAIPKILSVLIALGPWLLTTWMAMRNWRRLEGWERALVVAATFEFAVFIVVAMANEVRLFLPYAMVLIPTTTALILHELTSERLADEPA